MNELLAIERPTQKNLLVCGKKQTLYMMINWYTFKRNEKNNSSKAHLKRSS
jgi:hypothetical protein